MLDHPVVGLQPGDQIRQYLNADLLDVVVVVECHLEVPEREPDIVIDKAVNLPSRLFHPAVKCVFVDDVDKGVEDDVAGRRIEGVHSLFHRDGQLGRL